MGASADVVKGLYAAFGRGDVQAVVGTLDPEIEWREAESSPWAAGNPYRGPQAVLAGVFGAIASQLENFVVAPARVVEAGDSVLAEGRYTGRVKATGTAVDAQFAHVFHVRNGKVVSFQQYTDTAQWVRAYNL